MIAEFEHEGAPLPTIGQHSVVYDGAGQPVCVVVTVDALESGRGVKPLLLDAAAIQARRAGWRRLSLVTTNDNAAALRFYQRARWDLVAYRPNALARSRSLKPSIPQLGLDSIPIRHELELELAAMNAAGRVTGTPPLVPQADRSAGI